MSAHARDLRDLGATLERANGLYQGQESVEHAKSMLAHLGIAFAIIPADTTPA